MSAALQACESVLFLRKRLTFLRPAGPTSNNAGAPSMILAFGAVAHFRVAVALKRGLLEGAWLRNILVT